MEDGEETKGADGTKQGQETKAADGTKQSKRKSREVFPFGNYRSYYGYRIDQNEDEDPRLKVFKMEWFEGKDCLDIGCNSGLITIQIAKKFHCRSILGVDIDSDRIRDAYSHLKRDYGKKAPNKISEREVGGCENASKLSDQFLEDTKNQILKEHSSLKNIDLSTIVSFRQENFIHSHRPYKKDYGAILCLSVTKWVHLNWGDDGLIALFSKIWRLLQPGGIFILEPQPWKSYESNRNVSETTLNNYHALTIYPYQFQEILLDNIGFRKVEDINSSLSSSKTGFNRPILVFQK